MVPLGASMPLIAFTIGSMAWRRPRLETSRPARNRQARATR